MVLLEYNHHAEAISFQKYMAGYIAKRTHDCDAKPERSQGGLIFHLRVGLPVWLTKIIKRDLTYRETVEVDKGTARIHAISDTTDTDVSVRMIIQPDTSGNGTTVACTVDLDPRYCRVQIPLAPIRLFVGKRFRDERKRDHMFANMTKGVHT